MLIINSIKIRLHTSCHGVGCFKFDFYLNKRRKEAK